MKFQGELLVDQAIYRRVLKEEIPSANRSLVITTALVKQTRMESNEGIVPFCKMLSQLIRRGVQVTILFAGKPSMPFIRSLQEYPEVLSGALWRLCSRNHMKVVIVDGRIMYVGSANLTGAGLGMRGVNKRNFELGFVTRDTTLISRIADVIARIVNKDHCADCGGKRLCRKEHEEFLVRLRTPPETLQSQPRD